MTNHIQITGGPSICDGMIVTREQNAAIEIDSSGLDILPGLVDIHGDAFERALAPRPGVMIPLALAMAEFEAQLLAAGITTAFLAITLSWEAGLRSRATYEVLRDYVLARPAGSVPDLKLHIRFEAHNLACVDLAIADIAAGRVAMFSFNDHTPGMIRKLADPAATAKFADRAGQKISVFVDDANAVFAVPAERIEAGRELLAEACRKVGIPMASHDDSSIDQRDYFSGLGTNICEFPMTDIVAEAAMAQGAAVVMGAPNVVRGGSHVGWHGAEAMVKSGLCNVLCSDYHYHSMLNAAYKITRNGSATFHDAVNLVSLNPARAGHLVDRGSLDIGQRADVILVDPGDAERPPRIVMTIADGKIVYIAPDALPRIRINATSLSPASMIDESLTMTASA
jgi:alpha-D-ribose 1-methylphosphonate 5-triphosphate diphosphatase